MVGWSMDEEKRRKKDVKTNISFTLLGLGFVFIQREEKKMR